MIVSFHSVVLSTIHVRFLPLKIFGVTAVFVSSHVAFYFFFRFFFCKLSVHSVRVSWNRFQLIFVCGLGNI